MRTALQAVSLTASLSPYHTIFHYCANVNFYVGPEASFSSLLGQHFGPSPLPSSHCHRIFTSSPAPAALSPPTQADLQGQGFWCGVPGCPPSLPTHPHFSSFPFWQIFLLLYDVMLIWYFSWNLFQQGLSQIHFLPTQHKAKPWCRKSVSAPSRLLSRKTALTSFPWRERRIQSFGLISPFAFLYRLKWNEIEKFTAW